MFLRLYEFGDIKNWSVYYINNNNALYRTPNGNARRQTLKTDVDMFEMTNKTIKTWSNGSLPVFVRECV